MECGLLSKARSLPPISKTHIHRSSVYPSWTTTSSHYRIRRADIGVVLSLHLRFSTCHRGAVNTREFTAHVLISVMLLAAPWCHVAATTRCSGDCNGDGQVDIGELTRAVRIVLTYAPVLECPACDVNDDGMVTVNELIAAVAMAMSSCAAPPSPTATVTPVPSETDPALQAALYAAVQSTCQRSLSHVSASARTNTAAGMCEPGRGHATRITLTRYASPAAADAIFEQSIPPGVSEGSFEGYRAARWAEQSPSHPSGAAEYGNLLWALDCWVVQARSFDDTSYNLAPSVEQMSEAVLDETKDLLIDRCH